MKRSVLVPILVVILMGATFVTSVSGRCLEGCFPDIWEMRPYAGIFWMAGNKDECLECLSFSIYFSNVAELHKLLRSEERSSEPIRMSIAALVEEAVRYLKEENLKVDPIKCLVINHSLSYFEKQGFAVPLDKAARTNLLESKRRQKFESIIAELRTQAVERERADAIAAEAIQLAKEMRKTPKELGTSEEELQSFLMFPISKTK